MTRSGQRGQMAIAALGVGIILLLAVGAVGVVGAGDVAAVRAQRVADLAAVSAVRRVVTLTPVESASPNAARERVVAALAPVLAPDKARIEEVRFPSASAGAAGATVRVTVSIPAPLGLRATATAQAGLVVETGASGGTGWATGGGYSGPLVYRDGKPMCPSVAAAFDTMDAAARSSGVELTVTSGFRSDAEQAVLFARHPDPKWVAPPGHSRHRDATELDLGPPAAYRWLAVNAPRFGFVQRYSWEPWHYGYLAGCGDSKVVAAGQSEPPRPTSSLWGETGRVPPGGTFGANLPGVPAFVPAPYRRMVADGAVDAGVPPTVLAALLQAESGFNPRAVSPAGAQGIAQFMPATAASVGLSDPFDPGQAIPAAGRLLGTYLRRYGSVPLALAAYNAGPAAVQRYAGVPPYTETQSYVARILALVSGGSGGPRAGAWRTRVALEEIAE